MLSAAAAVTHRASLGSFVLNVMNRHPAVLARMAATLQGVAGGRARLGLGIGGHEREHEAYGLHFPPSAERAERLREAVGVLRALWGGGPANGAQSQGGVRLAAEVGDGWAAEAPQLDRLLPHYLEALQAAGRLRAEQLIVVGFGGGRSGVDALRGSPFVEAPAVAIAEWLARGADEVTVTARTAWDVDALVTAAGRW
jgi:alkanesulfonate monooxygenase SsuD/methylene tetrahydromethanopterin reductase-like flavin-dependent oxidoreductase (luciferase family)